MKHSQRLDLNRLAEVLHERGMANLDAIRELLQQSTEGGTAFCEALVTSDLVSDWDLSRVVSEIFQVPFLPVGMVKPNPEAMEGLDVGFFQQHQLVPLDRFGDVMTVAMPGLVPADVLGLAAASTDYAILPVVGTVETNRRWITENMQVAPAPEIEGGWGSLFDAADEKVRASLDGDAPPPEGSEGPDSLEDLGALGGEDLEFEVSAPDPDALEMDPNAGSVEDASMDLGDLGELETEDGDDGGELPPMPDFGRAG